MTFGILKLPSIPSVCTDAYPQNREHKHMPQHTSTHTHIYMWTHKQTYAETQASSEKARQSKLQKNLASLDGEVTKSLLPAQHVPVLNACAWLDPLACIHTQFTQDTQKHRHTHTQTHQTKTDTLRSQAAQYQYCKAHPASSIALDLSRIVTRYLVHQRALKNRKICLKKRGEPVVSTIFSMSALLIDTSGAAWPTPMGRARSWPRPFLASLTTAGAASAAADLRPCTACLLLESANVLRCLPCVCLAHLGYSQYAGDLWEEVLQTQWHVWLRRKREAKRLRDYRCDYARWKYHSV